MQLVPGKNSGNFKNFFLCKKYVFNCQVWMQHLIMPNFGNYYNKRLVVPYGSNVMFYINCIVVVIFVHKK